MGYFGETSFFETSSLSVCKGVFHGNYEKTPFRGKSSFSYKLRPYSEFYFPLTHRL